jgi:hypothetical protein
LAVQILSACLFLLSIACIVLGALLLEARKRPFVTFSGPTPEFLLPRKESSIGRSPETLSPKILVVKHELSKGAGGGLALRLENRGLTALENCRLKLISFASYHQELKQFRKPSFEPLILISTGKLEPEETTGEQWLARTNNDLITLRIPSGTQSEFRDQRSGGTWKAVFSVEAGSMSYEDYLLVEWQPGKEVTFSMSPPVLY